MWTCCTKYVFQLFIAQKSSSELVFKLNGTLTNVSWNMSFGQWYVLLWFGIKRWPKQFWLVKSVESNQLRELKLLIKYTQQICPAGKSWLKSNLELVSSYSVCKIFPSKFTQNQEIYLSWNNFNKPKISKLKEKKWSILLLCSGGKYPDYISLLFFLFFVFCSYLCFCFNL